MEKLDQKSNTIFLEINAIGAKNQQKKWGSVEWKKLIKWKTKGITQKTVRGNERSIKSRIIKDDMKKWKRRMTQQSMCFNLEEISRRNK